MWWCEINNHYKGEEGYDFLSHAHTRDFENYF